MLSVTYVKGRLTGGAFDRGRFIQGAFDRRGKKKGAFDRTPHGQYSMRLPRKALARLN